jgi:hypothetical protein
MACSYAPKLLVSFFRFLWLYFLSLLLHSRRNTYLIYRQIETNAFHYTAVMMSSFFLFVFIFLSYSIFLSFTFLPSLHFPWFSFLPFPFLLSFIFLRSFYFVLIPLILCCVLFFIQAKVGVSARTINQVNSRQKPLWGKTDRGIMFPLVKDLKHRTIFRRTMLEGILLRLVSGFLK